MNNLEIAKIYKRIYDLENINKIKNEDHHTYKIDDFGIISLYHIVIDKNYYYIKPNSSIYLNFSGYLISNSIANLTFRINILIIIMKEYILLIKILILVAGLILICLFIL